MNKQARLYERRKQLLPSSLGIFNPSSAERASNAIITNVDGQELIDFAGGIGVLNAGHCPPKVVKAIQDQAARLIHSSFVVAPYESYIDLAEKMVSLFPHGSEGTKAIMLSTGAEAIENAIKIARQATKRSAVIAYTNAFHGRTMMAMTLTSKVAYKADCGPFAPEVYRLPFPYYAAHKEGISEKEFSETHIQQLHDFFKTYVKETQVAAILLEIVQGEGGFYPVAPTYLKMLRQVCDEHGIVLIFDEIQSGFGRTGKWAAYEHYGVVPDLSTWAKSLASGMPLSAVLGKTKIIEAINPSTLGGTYAGNPICCAAALATIQYMEEININALGEKVGKIVRAKFEALQAAYPQVIYEVRGLGAMLAIELVKKGDPLQPDAELAKKIVEHCAAHGLIILSAGVKANVLRILSPLTIEDDVLNKGLTILEQAFKACLA